MIERCSAPLGERLRRSRPGSARQSDTLKRVRERCRRGDTSIGRASWPLETPQAFLAPMLATRVLGGSRRRHRLRVARRARRRPSRDRRGRPETAEGHHAGRSRARSSRGSEGGRLRRRRDARRRGALVAPARGPRGTSSRTSVWAALGVTIARGEEHTALWGHLGIEQPPRRGAIPYSTSTTSTPTRSTASMRVRALGLRVGIVGNQTEALEAWARDCRPAGRRDLVVREPRSARSPIPSSSRGRRAHGLPGRRGRVRG